MKDHNEIFFELKLLNKYAAENNFPVVQEKGIYPSFAPLGYINVECNGKRFIQPDPVVGPSVRKLFEWYATGNYSLLELAYRF